MNTAKPTNTPLPTLLTFHNDPKIAKKYRGGPHRVIPDTKTRE